MATVAENEEEKTQKRPVVRKRPPKTALTCPHCGNEVELVGTGEAVALLEVSPATFQVWKNKDDFPEPAWHGGQGALWLKQDVLDWHEGRQAREGEKYASKLKVALDGMTEQERESTLRELLAALDSKSRERLLKS